MGSVENQVHTSTKCKHKELIYIRKVYKKDIESILTAFKHLKIPRKDKWITHIMSYVSQHVWGDTETTSDIWNGRWNRHMWEEALTDVDEKIKKNIDPKLCKKWLNIITQKLFEAQSALSRHRFKLSKRLKDPMFERSQKISPALKKHILKQSESQAIEELGQKRRKKENPKENAPMPGPSSKRKRTIQEGQNAPPISPSTHYNKKTKHEAKGSLKRFSHRRNREEESREQSTSTQIGKKRAISKDSKNRKSEYNPRNTKMRRTQINSKLKQTDIHRDSRSSTANKRSHTSMQSPTNTGTSKPHKKRKRRVDMKENKDRRNRQSSWTTLKSRQQWHRTNKAALHGKLRRKGWHCYLRHTYTSRYRVRYKHKLDNASSPYPKRNRR